MSVWFIDLKVLTIDTGLKELCVMNINDVLHPTHYVFYGHIQHNYLTNHGLGWVEDTCEAWLCNNNYKKDMFYVVDTYNGDKIKDIKSIFPLS